MNLRAAAATILCNVMNGVSLTEALSSINQPYSDARDQAFLQAVCYGVCRWYIRLDAVLRILLDKPLKANNQLPPFTLRVNQKKQTREAYLAELTKKQIDAFLIPETKMGICLKEPMDVRALPGFQNGEVSVQDGAAQLAAELLDVQKEHRV